MAEEAGNNVINNYKGVMLCSRPNEKKAITTEKPFCGRVVPGQQLGINPVKHEHPPEPEKLTKNNGALSKHKQWLNHFKETVQKTKMDIEQKNKKEEEKFKKIKEQAEADRQRAKKMKQEYQQTANQILNVLDQKAQPSAPKTGELTFDNLRRLDAANEQEQKPKQAKKGEEFKKKGDKPVWAMTKEAAEQNEQKQMDELLDFFQQNDMNDFSQDEEIKHLLKNLKEKIESMKTDDNWKEKEGERLRKAKENREEGGEDDKYSQFSGGKSEGKSVASEKSQKKMEELRAKMKEPKEWDKNTTSEKNSCANLQDRIAKNLADEVLRNYPGMRGVHSNISIRKLLEAQAAKVMNQPIIRPVITTVVREKNPINANTLPYLHRNPAI